MKSIKRALGESDTDIFSDPCYMVDKYITLRTIIRARTTPVSEPSTSRHFYRKPPTSG
jgi:hypothetical protein